jgi:uncharacterized protein (DUF2345 family)
MPYDAITGNDIEKIDYIAGAVDTELYPDSNNISIFGPIWLPRVYGKDLTSFEIASSGKLSIVINDVQALDISKSGRITSLTAKSNDSFVISINSNEMSMGLDATNNTVTLASSNDIVVTASNNVSVRGSNSVFVDASNDVSIKANRGSLNVSAGLQNMTLTMDSNNNKTTLYSSNDIMFNTSNNFLWVAKSNIEIVANEGYFNLMGQGSNTYIMMDSATDNLSIYSSNDTYIDTSNNFRVQTNSNVSIGAVGTGYIALSTNSSNTSFVTEGTNNTTTLYSSNDITVTTSNDFIQYAENDTTITTHVGTLKLTTNDDNTYQSMNNSNILVYASSNLTVGISNNINIEASSNIGINAKNKTLSIAARASNMLLTMDSATDNVTIYGSNAVILNTSNHLVIEATSNIDLKSTDGSYSLYAYSNAKFYTDASNLTFEMLKNGKIMNLYSASNINITASNTLNILAESNLVVITHSNAYFGSASNFTITTSNNGLFSASNNLTLSASNDLTLEANTINFNTRADMALTALSNFKYYISSSPFQASDAIFQITGSNVAVRGDLFITGSINTTQILQTVVTETTLTVNDKLIYLASVGSGPGVVSDSNPFDGVANDKAGIQVDGIPSTAANDDSSTWPLWEKSIKWHYNVDGLISVGTTHIEKEACWEFMGGGVRITKNSNMSGSMKKLSFTWRIGHNDELELVKTWWNGTDYVYKRIAKFGRVL